MFHNSLRKLGLCYVFVYLQMQVKFLAISIAKFKKGIQHFVEFDVVVCNFLTK